MDFPDSTLEENRDRTLVRRSKFRRKKSKDNDKKSNSKDKKSKSKDKKSKSKDKKSKSKDKKSKSKDKKSKSKHKTQTQIPPTPTGGGGPTIPDETSSEGNTNTGSGTVVGQADQSGLPEVPADLQLQGGAVQFQSSKPGLAGVGTMRFATLTRGNVAAGTSDDNAGPLITGDEFRQTINSTFVDDQKASGMGLSEGDIPSSSTLIIALSFAFVVLISGAALLLYRCKHAQESRGGPKRNILSKLVGNYTRQSVRFQRASPITNDTASTVNSVHVPEIAYDVCDEYVDSVYSVTESGGCPSKCTEGSLNASGDIRTIPIEFSGTTNSGNNLIQSTDLSNEFTPTDVAGRAKIDDNDTRMFLPRRILHSVARKSRRHPSSKYTVNSTNSTATPSVMSWSNLSTGMRESGEARGTASGFFKHTFQMDRESNTGSSLRWSQLDAADL
ncbi:MAG: hypothetical protein SGCHY_002994 [Lobulomycetales sp.]